MHCELQLFSYENNLSKDMYVSYKHMTFSISHILVCVRLWKEHILFQHFSCISCSGLCVCKLGLYIVHVEKHTYVCTIVVVGCLYASCRFMLCCQCFSITFSTVIFSIFLSGMQKMMPQMVKRQQHNNVYSHIWGTNNLHTHTQEITHFYSFTKNIF